MMNLSREQRKIERNSYSYSQKFFSSYMFKFIAAQRVMAKHPHYRVKKLTDMNNYLMRLFPCIKAILPITNYINNRVTVPNKAKEMNHENA
jgi:hypothetical protein